MTVLHHRLVLKPRHLSVMANHTRILQTCEPMYFVSNTFQRYIGGGMRVLSGSHSSNGHHVVVRTASLVGETLVPSCKSM